MSKRHKHKHKHKFFPSHSALPAKLGQMNNPNPFTTRYCSILEIGCAAAAELVTAEGGALGAVAALGPVSAGIEAAAAAAELREAAKLVALAAVVAAAAAAAVGGAAAAAAVAGVRAQCSWQQRLKRFERC